MNFDARCSQDDLTSDDLLAFQWDFESDGVVTGRHRASHVYAQLAASQLTLRVGEASGSSDVLRREVVVKP